MPGQLSTMPNAGLPAGARRKSGRDRAFPAAGILYVTTAGDALFLKRQGSDHAGTWSIPAGGIDRGESAEDAARRESSEEVGHEPDGELEEIDRSTTKYGVDFTTFRKRIADRFDPEINDESEAYIWAPLDDPPHPLHPALAEFLDGYVDAEDAGESDDPEARIAGLLEEFFREETEESEHGKSDATRELYELFKDEKAQARLKRLAERRGESIGDSHLRFAFDKASVRKFDSDGRMKVDIANLSKAQIRPYRGDEIPEWKDLGLDRDKTYKMLCPADELEKAAPTFNGIQLLQKHIPVDADDHQMWDIVGTTGSEARFENPYLKNSLFVWTQRGIDLIESNERRELSCGYHYVPEMTPGTFEGEHYDGIMRNIEGNHVALVSEGRAGHDVQVADDLEDFQWAAIESALLGLKSHA